MALRRAFRRLAAEKVPDVFVNFGVEQQFRFINHPGVMAVSKLLEMRFIAKPRANFTQENIEAMKEFDEDLARKAQIALDNNIAVNMKDLEAIDTTLPQLLEEKKQLDAMRSATAALPPGKYDVPKVGTGTPTGKIGA